MVDPDAEDRKLERQLDREERASHHTRYLTIASDGAGGVRLKGRGSAEDGALLKAALLPLTTPTPAATAGTSTTTTGRWSTTRAMPVPGCGTPWSPPLSTRWTPTCHPTVTAHPPDSLVTTTLESLRHGLAHRRRSSELSVATIRRLACDAEVIPAVLGTHSEPLDVGRAKRLVTAAIWTALVLRDHHCAFPGCDRPPLMCHAHHITHWTNGGETNLAISCWCAATTTAPSTTHPGKSAPIPTTTDPNSNHHPNPASNHTGSDTDHAAREVDSEAPYARRVTRARLDKQPSDVRRMFDDVAKRYDVTNDVLSLGQDRRLAQGGLRRRRVEARASSSSTSPPAPAPRASRSSTPARPSFPCDFSLGMLRVGKKARPHLPFTAGDGTRLPFADDVFDAVTISFGLRNIVDPVAGLREMRRVTRPGGRSSSASSATRRGRRSAPCTSSTSCGRSPRSRAPSPPAPTPTSISPSRSAPGRTRPPWPT